MELTSETGYGHWRKQFRSERGRYPSVSDAWLAGRESMRADRTFSPPEVETLLDDLRRAEAEIARLNTARVVVTTAPYGLLQSWIEYDSDDVLYEVKMPRRSTTTYPPNWPEIAKEVKAQANWHCVRCGHIHDPASGHTLTVHHLDLSPANCEWWNLAPLCQKCHLTIQAKVVMERVWWLPHSEWFKPYAAGYYGSLYGLPTDRDYFSLTNLDGTPAHFRCCLRCERTETLL